MAKEQRIQKRPEQTGRKNVGARRLTTALILFVCILVFTTTAIILTSVYRRRATDPNAGQNSDSTFGITALSVSGQLRYTEEELLHVSGLRIGKSVWEISEQQAKQNILDACPYVDSVTIDSPSFGVYHITIKETTVLGALADKGEWVLIGKNGNELERLPMHSDTPQRMLYLQGAVYTGTGPGKPAMDERTVRICQTLDAALSKANVDKITCFDLSDLSNIRLEWNNQIVVSFGTDANLETQVAVFGTLLFDHILPKHGQLARGTLDLTAYSSDSVPDQAIFTPEDISKG